MRIYETSNGDDLRRIKRTLKKTRHALALVHLHDLERGCFSDWVHLQNVRDPGIVVDGSLKFYGPILILKGSLSSNQILK